MVSGDETERIARALGAYVQAFGNLEQVMHIIAWNLLGSDAAIGTAVTERLIDRELCELMKRLAELETSGPPGLTADDRIAIRQLADRIVALLPERNELVHGFWASTSVEFDEYAGRNIRKFARELRTGSEATRYQADGIRLALRGVVAELARASELSNRIDELWGGVELPRR